MIRTSSSEQFHKQQQHSQKYTVLESDRFWTQLMAHISRLIDPKFQQFAIMRSEKQSYQKTSCYRNFFWTIFLNLSRDSSLLAVNVSEAHQTEYWLKLFVSPILYISILINDSCFYLKKWYRVVKNKPFLMRIELFLSNCSPNFMSNLKSVISETNILRISM